MKQRAPFRPMTRLIAAAAIAVGMLAAAAPAALASGTGSSQVGWIRLAHLSPNAPAVDVYLYSLGSMKAKIVLKHVSYGTVASYQQLPAGEYTVAMRAAGSSATSKEILSTTVHIVAGHAYTVAGMGPAASLRLQILDDQLSTPPGRSLVRVIQASLKDKRVTVSLGGTVLVHDLAFGSATTYTSVAPGTVDVRVSGGSMQASKAVSLSAGTSHTIVVLDSAGHLSIDLLMDAAGASLMPKGAASTGFGGMAPRPSPSPLPWAAVVALGALVAGAGGLRLLRTRSRA